MANTQITWNNGTTGNRKTWTWSFWLKRSKINSEQCVWTTRYNASNNHLFRFNSNNTFSFKGVNSADGTIMDLDSNQVFKDCNSWYHFVLAVDSTQSTAADRAKVYVNGTQITSFATADYGAQNQSFEINEANNQVFWIGSENSQNYFDGCLSHVWFIDGTQYAASTFGETDATTGEWKIKTNPTVTMGTNGFQILKDGNGITDTSSNSNNFSASSGTLTNLKDCPSHVFCTLNPLIRSANGSFASTNNKFTTSGGAWGSSFGTMGMLNGQGKYYMEFKGVSGTKLAYGISDFKPSGVIDRTQRGENRYCGEYANSYSYHYGGNFYYSGSSTGTGYDSFTASDVIGMAVDMDNLKIYFHKNGSYQDSKNPASDNGYTIVAPEGAYLPTICVEDAGAAANFGNGIFDTTAISSAGTNASNFGTFEYDVPSGYTALSTKGFNT